jgi:hypothetical protein
MQRHVDEGAGHVFDGLEALVEAARFFQALISSSGIGLPVA